MSRSRVAELLLAGLCASTTAGAVALSLTPPARADAPPAPPPPPAPPAPRKAEPRAGRAGRPVRAWDYDWDRKGAGKEGGGSRTLYLVRHGQYANVDSSDDDAKHTLTPLGREQAAQTGRRLAALLGSTPVRCVTHSTMTRAAETAALVAQALPGVPLRPCALLREGAPVRPEPDTWKPRERDVWADSARIEAAFREHFRRAEPGEPPAEVVVCHGNVIRFCTLRALQLPPEAWLRLGLANGSITKVVMRADGGVSVHCLGDAGHFEPALITFN